MVLLATILNNYVNTEKKKEEERKEEILKYQSFKASQSGKNFKSTNPQTVLDNIMKLSLMLIFFYILCGCVAAYMSWTSNGKIGYSKTKRFFFAAFAFFCPFEYLTIHMTYKSDFLMYMERTKTEFVELNNPSPPSP